MSEKLRGNNMQCPYCRNDKLNIYRVIQKSKKNFRYIECKKCHKKFKTIEYVPSNWDYERLYKGLVRELDTTIYKYKEKYEGEW